MRSLFALLLLAAIALAQTQQELVQLQQLILELNITQDSVIVVGSDIDGETRAMLDVLRSRLLGATNLTTLSDTPETLSIVESGRARTFLLIGGPSQNAVSEAAYQRGWMGNETRFQYLDFSIKSGQSSGGARLVLISNPRGFENRAKEGLAYSPLRFLVKEEQVPAAATGLTVLILALWTLARFAIARYITGLATKEHKINDRALRILGIKIREVASFIGANIIFAVAVTYVFTGPTSAFLALFPVNILTTFFVFTAHELVHWLVGRIYALRMEYQFWWFGSILTVLSGIMGNPFGLAGYMIEEDANATRRRIGIMKLSGPLFSILLATLFALINLFFANQIFQMIYTLASTLAIVELLPTEPLAGWRVRQWSPWAWFFSFLFVAFLYVLINFIL